MDLSLNALRVLRVVAERGSFTAAATSAGYTQSAVSRQIASLEAAVGRPLFDRRRDGVRLTDGGRRLLARATRILDELDLAEQELSGVPPARVRVRLGVFTSAGGGLLPLLVHLTRGRDDLDLVTQTGSTPALVRGLRAGSLDLAVVAAAPPFRPLDTESPQLVTRDLAEHELLVAVPDGHPLAATGSVSVEQLREQTWVASRASAGDGALGVWPGLPGRPRVAHSTPDWLAKLELVAAGGGLTTIPQLLVPLLPRGVRAVRVVDGSREERRMMVARLPEAPAPLAAGVALVEDVLVQAVQRGWDPPRRT